MSALLYLRPNLASLGALSKGMNPTKSKRKGNDSSVVNSHHAAHPPSWDAMTIEGASLSFLGTAYFSNIEA